MNANAVAHMLVIPRVPEVSNGRTTKKNRGIKGDAEGNDQPRSDPYQPPCQGDVAEKTVVEEQN